MQPQDELVNIQAKLKAAEARIAQLEQFQQAGILSDTSAHELKQPLNVAKIICQSLVQDIQKDRLEVPQLKDDLLEVVSQLNELSEIIASLRRNNQKEEDNGISGA